MTVILMVVQEPSIKIAVTHDSQWIAMLKSLEGVRSHLLSPPFFNRCDAETIMDAGRPGEPS